MLDRKPGFSSVDIFLGSSATSYIDYYCRPRPEWEYLEKPMWEIILEKLNVSQAVVLDVGTGTGKLYDLLVQAGANPDKVFAVEPNSELANYLFFKRHIKCIKDSTHHLNNITLQQGEFDLLTANMVLNHLTTDEYDDFIQYTKGILMADGLLIYTTPFPKEKSEKHKFDYTDNHIMVEEKAPWGGMVKYYHRSEEYQVEVLERNGFEAKRIFWGYENFISKRVIEDGERATGKSLRGPKRLMFWARKI